MVHTESAHWTELESWWGTFIDSATTPLWPKLATIAEIETTAANWSCIDSWWETNIESEREALVTLNEALENAHTAWAASPSRFNSDPLTVDWDADTGTTGPLRTHQEENWSQWLAHLIRTGPPEFSRALFGDEFRATPRSVEREVHLPAHDNDRYADILIFYDGHAISIEVKKGDEHYGKTIDTASLLESQFQSKWHHKLLLPSYKLSALERSPSIRLSETTDGEIIVSDQLQDIDIMVWSDVGRAIRAVLLSDVETTPHWEASAYVFCTLIEQKLARFVPQQVVDGILASKKSVQTASSVLIDRQNVDKQIAYLRDTTVSADP